MLTLVLSLGGCGESSADGVKPPGNAYGGSESGGSASGGGTESECNFDIDEDGYCNDVYGNEPEPDCDDSNPDIHPGATEAANAIDDDCDGVVDNGVVPACPLTLDAPEGGCEQAKQLVTYGPGACMLLDSGRVLCWGLNTGGALGTPDVVNAPVPIAVPGVAEATALVSGTNVVCALAGGAAVCWGAGSAYPFTVPLPARTTQIALGMANEASGGRTHYIAALDDASQVWTRPLFAPEAATTFEFVKGEVGVAQLIGGTAVCLLDTDDTLRCPDAGLFAIVARDVELATQSFDGSLCYKSGGQLYCSATPAAGTVVAGNGSAAGAALGDETGCAFGPTGKLACWTKNGPSSVTDATQVALGAELGCILRSSGKVSCWGNSDGGRLGDGRVSRQQESEPVDVSAAPTLELPSTVLLGAFPLGACDTPQDLGALHDGVDVHAAMAGCKEQCKDRLDASECFATCAKPAGLSSGCFGCYANLATCAGADCYAAFQACAGYPVDFAAALSNHPRFDCPGASCLHGKSVGEACSEQDVCATGSCGELPQAPGAKVCIAADGAFCTSSSAHCACRLGTDGFGDTNNYGYCGFCTGDGRTASQAGDCYRDCTTESYCTADQTCKYFSDNRTRYCSY